jgi:predicted ATP-binding protein involved in virulence
MVTEDKRDKSSSRFFGIDGCLDSSKMYHLTEAIYKHENSRVAMLVRRQAKDKIHAY